LCNSADFTFCSTLKELKPVHIVAEVFRGHTVKSSHPRLQALNISVDILDVVEALDHPDLLVQIYMHIPQLMQSGKLLEACVFIGAAVLGRANLFAVHNTQSPLMPLLQR